jgi:PAS domain S-box-containing protein
VDERDRQRVDASFRQAIGGQGEYDVEFRVTWPDGSLHWLWSRGRFFFDEHGKAFRVAGIQVDITRRRAAEEALRENEQRLNVAVAGGGLGLWDWQVDTRVWNVNERWLTMLGLPPGPSALNIDFLYSIVHPDDVDWVKASDAALIANPSVNDFAQDIRVRHADGRYLWFRDRGAVVERDAQGLALRIAGTHIDVTRRKEAEALLLEREALLVQAQRLAQLGNWRWTNGQQLRQWSDETCRIFGIDRDSFELTDENIMSLVHPEDRGGVEQSSRLAKAGLGTYDIEYRIVTPAGELKYVHSRADVARDPTSGEVSALVGSVLDITQRTLQQQELAASRDELERQVEQRTRELIAARDMAEQANRAKSLFLSRMSHELRTPLNAVLGFSQLLELDPHIAASTRASAQISHIHHAGDHLLAMIDEVLDLARIETGGLRLSPEVVEVGPLVAECVNLAMPLSNRYGLSIGTEHMADGLCVLADRVRLRQIMVNLITNAIKYNRPGGSVNITLKPNGAEVDIAISDTGRGLNAGQLAQMFQPFNRLGAESHGVEGTGLGLVIAKQLCEAMGGLLRVESAVSVGSTFTVSLPAIAGSDDDSHADTTPGQLSPCSDASFRVLYVEDNPINVELMDAALSRSEGVIVDTAATGRAGVASALARQPDLILLDIDLPDMSGLEVLYELRHHESLARVPCVAVSANAMGPEVRRALDCGFDRYLTKPFSVAKLLMLVESYRAERPTGFADSTAVSGHDSFG